MSTDIKIPLAPNARVYSFVAMLFPTQLKLANMPQNSQ